VLRVVFDSQILFLAGKGVVAPLYAMIREIASTVNNMVVRDVQTLPKVTVPTTWSGARIRPHINISNMSPGSSADRR